MSKTTSERTATTPHGEVTYETVKCDSCGQSVKKDDAYAVLIGDRVSDHSAWKIRGKRAELYACEHCVEEPLRWKITDSVSIVGPDIGPDIDPVEAGAWIVTATVTVIYLLIITDLLMVVIA